MKIFEKILIISFIFIMLFSANYLVIAATYEAIEEIITENEVESDNSIIDNITEDKNLDDEEKIDETLVVEDVQNLENEDAIVSGQLQTSIETVSTENEETIIEDEIQEEQSNIEEDDDPQPVTRMGQSTNKMFKSARSAPVENISDLINRFEVSGNEAVGIDVSAYQADIDWAKVVASGVKFAMIRCGFRGYGSEGNMVEDKMFRKNVEGAINNGIYVGIYFYSTALNEQEARDEANFTVNLIRKYDIKYPVCYDFELYNNYYSPTGNPYRTNGLSTEQMNKNAEAFLSVIRANGYIANLYASASPLKDKWSSSLTSNYDVWIAHYYVSKPGLYTGNYSIWQYTDIGRVPGISTNVDIDVDYRYYSQYHNIDITPYIFDSAYYADRYEDLKRAFGNNASALKNHYLTSGIREGRSASPCFDPRYYLNKYADLRAAFGSRNYEQVYYHFINYGIKEGRQGSKYFDVNYYLKISPDLKRIYYSSKTLALMHFSLYGASEGRRGSSDFSAVAYRTQVSGYYKQNLGTDYKRYMALDAGSKVIINDPIDITPYIFDSAYYADRYEDLKRAFGNNASALKNHYLTSGIREGRTASPCFDPRYYLNKYADLKRAYGNNYEKAYYHFVNYGINEGRQGSKYFSAKYYHEKCEDLRNWYGNNYSKMLMHFSLYGANEGRQGSSEFFAVTYRTQVSGYYKQNLGTNYKKYMALDAGSKVIINDPIDITPYIFDSAYYADRYEDLKRAFGNNASALKNHYLTSGIREGRTASPCFDPRYYLNKYADLKKVYGNNYEKAYYHFVNYGINEGRQGSKYFSAKYYHEKCEDLRNWYGNNYSKMLMHFSLYGANEGRQGSSDFSVKEYRNTLSPNARKLLGTDYKKYIALDSGAQL